MVTFLTAKRQQPDQQTPKILYSPNTTSTRSIMHRANVTFATVEFVLNWMKQIDNCTDYFLNNINESNVDIVRDYTGRILKTQPNNSNIQLIHDLVDVNSSNNIWNILHRVQSASENIQATIRLIDWDIFYPVENEQELVKLASNVSLQNEKGISFVFAGK